MNNAVQQASAVLFVQSPHKWLGSPTSFTPSTNLNLLPR